MPFIPKNEYEPIEPGVFEAVLDDISVEENPFEKDEEQIKFVFKITDDEHQGEKVFGFGSPTLSPKSNLYRWGSALMSEDLLQFAGIELEDLLEKPCRIVLINKNTQDGRLVHRISEVLPPKGVKLKIPQPAKPAADDDESATF